VVHFEINAKLVKIERENIMIMWLVFAAIMACGLFLTLRMRKNIKAKIEAEAKKED
jgi:hypothetical protein